MGLILNIWQSPRSPQTYRAALGLDPTYQPADMNLERATTNLKARPRLTMSFSDNRSTTS
ncbi:hypothetical protein [Synechococcus sp. 7002]|uniref:hypothetical protein n=1 Tax=Synechococcus sp. 7002 TaxID=1938862 RepID=UPI0030DAC814